MKCICRFNSKWMRKNWLICEFIMGFIICWRSNLSYHDIRSFYVRSENALDSRAGGELVLPECSQLFNVGARQKISMASLTLLLNMSSSLARTEEEDIFQSIRSLRARSSFLAARCAYHSKRWRYGQLARRPLLSQANAIALSALWEQSSRKQSYFSDPSSHF